MADSMSLVRRNYRHPTDTVGLSSVAQKARVSEIVGRIVNRLKDKAERYGHGNYYQGCTYPTKALALSRHPTSNLNLQNEIGRIHCRRI
ncbi:hypothetical protein JOM56_014819, partial [Amanita muscaria]